GVAGHPVALGGAAPGEGLPEQRIRHERSARRRCGQWWDQLKEPERLNERRREHGVDEGEARAQLAQVGERGCPVPAARGSEHQDYPADRSHEGRPFILSTPACLDGVTTRNHAHAAPGLEGLRIDPPSLLRLRLTVSEMAEC